MTVEVGIRGTSALLMHRFDEGAEADGAAATRRVMVSRGTPREEAQKCAYQSKDGKFYLPSTAFARMLREAGGNHKLKGSRRSAKFVVPAAVRPVGDVVYLTNGDGKTPAKDFEVDSRPVTIPATKGRIMRHRPRFDCWSACVTLAINDKLLPPDFIQTLMVEGGQQIGVGDFRPERGGPFGTFHVDSWQVVK